MTSSYTKDADELEEFLIEIQERSQDILADKYKKLAMPVIEHTESYLRTTLKGSQLSESELDEQEEKLHKQLSSLNAEFSREKEDFDREISECIREIKADIQSAMEAEESALVAMALNNQRINDHLNSVVRSAVTVSVKKRFIPKVEKYLKKVAETINSESVSDVQISFAFDAEKLNKGITGSIVAVAAGLLLGVPILGIIAGLLMKFSMDKKREEAKQEIRQRLRSEVFPQVLREVGSGIEMTVMKQTALVNTSITI